MSATRAQILVVHSCHAERSEASVGESNWKILHFVQDDSLVQDNKGDGVAAEKSTGPESSSANHSGTEDLDYIFLADPQ